MANEKRKVRFRTLETASQFKGFERGGGVSMCDTSQDEPLSDIIGRLLRGDPGAGMPLEGAFDGAMESEADVVAAMDSQPIYERDGFDMGDAVRVLDEAKEILRKAEEAKARARKDGKATDDGPSKAKEEGAKPPVEPSTDDLPERA